MVGEAKNRKQKIVAYLNPVGLSSRAIFPEKQSQDNWNVFQWSTQKSGTVLEPILLSGGVRKIAEINEFLVNNLRGKKMGGKSEFLLVVRFLLSF